MMCTMCECAWRRRRGGGGRIVSATIFQYYVDNYRSSATDVFKLENVGTVYTYNIMLCILIYLTCVNSAMQYVHKQGRERGVLKLAHVDQPPQTNKLCTNHVQSIVPTIYSARA